MSRQFSEVGVGMPPQRIREIAMGRPATEDELVDVGFALTVTQLLNENGVPSGAAPNAVVPTGSSWSLGRSWH